MGIKLLGTLLSSLLLILSEPLFGQQFLGFPLSDTSVSVHHGWFFDNGDNHYGIDYIQPLGTPVLAAADGKAMASTQPPDPSKDAYGLFVLIKHANGYSTLYAHLSGIAPAISPALFPHQDRWNSSFNLWVPVNQQHAFVVGAQALS